MDNSKILDNNLSDKLAALNRAIIGIIPYAGPVLSEIICAVIPNQRLDRAVKFLKAIDSKVNELSKIIIEDQNKIRLIETGLKASTNSNFEAKCEWIGNIVNNGLDEKVDIHIADEIIQIVDELNYEQILILYHYCNHDKMTASQAEQFNTYYPELFQIHKFQSKDLEKHEILLNKDRLNVSKLSKSGLIIKEFKIPTSLRYGLESSSSKEIELINDKFRSLEKVLNDFSNTNNYKPTKLGRLLISTMLISEKSFEIE